MGRNPNKKKKIPFQARRLVRDVLSGKHKTLKDAGLAAVYHPDSVHRTLSTSAGTISEAMDAAGLTDANLVENCLSPLLNATQVKHFQHKGKVRDEREVADNDIRLRALDIALRIKGKYAPIAVEQAHKNTVKFIVLDIPRPKRDVPPPTVIEVAQLPENGNGHTKGNGNNGHKE